jgi:hypothetical protein
VIDQAAVVRKSRAHLGLVTQALTTPEDPVWLPAKSTLREPPEGQGPPATGPRSGRGSVLLGEPLFDELPAEDWGRNWATGRSAGWRSFAQIGRISLNGRENSRLTVGDLPA